MEVFITEQWNKYLVYFTPEQKDIYFTEEYVHLYESDLDRGRCAVCIEHDFVMLFPFLRRECKFGYDFETAYGYGGPISNCSDQVWNRNALESIGKMLVDCGYICGFTRFHTLLNNQNLCRDVMQVIYDRPTIAIDLKPSEEDIWKFQIISKNRNMIRKAEKNGLVYSAEYDYESLDGFISLYLETMNRLGADDFYCFDSSYFLRFKESFHGRSFLGTVKKDNTLVCAAMFMYSDKYGHYHLEGSDHSYSSLGANNLLLWKTALELKKNGVEEFHLGGGYNSALDNTLLKFKKSFSNNMKDFYIGKWLFDKEKYDCLKNNWMEKNPEKVDTFGKLLLCYRY